MASSKLFFLIITLLLLTGCPSQKTGNSAGSASTEGLKAVSGQFTITGAYALHPLVLDMAESFMKLHPDVRIIVKRTGSGEGISELLTKNSQLAMISRQLTDEEINAGIWVLPVAKDGVAPIVNQKNPYIEKIIGQGFTPEEFLRIFTSDIPATWGEVLGINTTERIKVFTRADESGAADVWSDFLYKDPSDLKGTGVVGDDEMISRVQGDPLSIGFCNFSYAFDRESGERKENIQIIPCDLDFDNRIEITETPFASLAEAHRSLWLGFYPDNLCRELTIGSLGKPSDPLIVEFLKYVLGKGQESVQTSGFCPLNNVYLSHAIESLD